MNSNRVVLITGAAGAIGSAVVDRFLANADQVIATDLDAAALAELASTRQAGSRLVTVAGDISEESDCALLAQTAREASGRVDVLIHCAGYFPIRKLEDMTPQEWRQVIDVNLTGTFLLTRALLPLMKGRGWGRIINFTSGSIFEGVPGQSHYVAAKAGVLGFSRSIARELGVYGITVNMVSPGLTVTPAVLSQFPPQLLEDQRRRRAIGRDETPHDLVGTTFFLASPDADFLSGQTIQVDGGKTMH